MISSADTLKDPTMMMATIGFWAFLRAAGNGDMDQGLLALGTREEAETRDRKVGEAKVEAANHLITYHGLSPRDAAGMVRDTHNAISMDPNSMGTNFVLRAGWYNCGMPVITLGHKLAASYMCTKMPHAVIDEVRSPFPVFLLEIPDGLLRMMDEHNEVSMQSVLIGYLPDATRGHAWSYCVYTSGISTIWRKHWRLSEFVRQHMENEGEALPSAFGVEMTDLDSRSVELLGRLIVSAMLHMTQKSQVKPIGKGHQGHREGSRNGAEPTRRVFQLCHEVRHDMRQAVKDYVGGNLGAKISVQLVVSGHWKQQAHGPHMSLRKRQFIEPYWRGPEDAPIAFRSHVLDPQDRAKIGDKREEGTTRTPQEETS